MYRALYRKWRPMTFSDVIGQEHITNTLSKEVMSQKTSHAYLFTGSRGTGKTTCAKILAKAVNCLNPVDGSPCNECTVCRGIDEGTILDVIEIDAASNNGVDNIRDLRDETNYKPVNASFRVYIIDEVHMLSAGAFNALLKTLEEPPAYVKFILATTEVHKLPATILSRCQRFDFRRITTGDIFGRLKYVADKENISLEDSAAMLIARISDGGMRDALSLLDRCSGVSDTVTEDIVTRSVGLADKKRIFDLVDSINSGNVSDSLTVIDSLYADSCDMERLCGELITHYRNLMIFKAAKKHPENLIVATSQDIEQYKRQSETVVLSRIISCISELEAASVILKTSQNKRVAVEMAIIKMSENNRSAAVPSDIEARISLLERKLSNISVSAAGDKTAPSGENTFADGSTGSNPVVSPEADTPQNTPAAPSGNSANRINGENPTFVPFTRWAEVISELNTLDKPIVSFLIGSSAVVSDNMVVIQSGNPVFSSFVKQDNHATLIRKAIYNITGKKYRLSVSTVENTTTDSKDPLADLINKISN